MPATTVDYRTVPWDIAKIDSSGKDVGPRLIGGCSPSRILFALLIHSVLSIQIRPNWWAVGVDRNIQGKVTKFKADYALQPWHGTPGSHDLYYAQLLDLAKILRDNSNLFLPMVLDIDAWVAKLDQIGLPRNIVGHMNWPTGPDRKRIEAIHADFQALMKHLETSGLAMVIPS